METNPIIQSSSNFTINVIHLESCHNADLELVGLV